MVVIATLPRVTLSYLICPKYKSRFYFRVNTRTVLIFPDDVVPGVNSSAALSCGSCAAATHGTYEYLVPNTGTSTLPQQSWS